MYAFVFAFSPTDCAFLWPVLFYQFCCLPINFILVNCNYYDYYYYFILVFIVIIIIIIAIIINYYCYSCNFYYSSKRQCYSLQAA